MRITSILFLCFAFISTPEFVLAQQPMNYQGISPTVDINQSSSPDTVKQAKIDSYLSKIKEFPEPSVSKPGFLYNTYQRFISSNDSNSCPFSPSCSAYASQAIKSKGLIKGIILAGDRLQRCSGSPTLIHDYPIDPHTHRLADPVK